MKSHATDSCISHLCAMHCSITLVRTLGACSDIGHIMGSEPEPWRCTTTVVLEGGYLKKAWPCPVQSVGGLQFMCLKKNDSHLLKGLGYTVQYVHSEGVKKGKELTVFEYIRLTRNKAVDDIILEKSADPMADEGMEVSRVNANRSKVFTEVSVEAIIPVKLAAFVTPSGTRIGEHTMNVISTPSRVPAPMVECCPATMQWLMEACTIDWQAEQPELFAKVSSRKRPPPEALPPLASPLKYSTSGKLAIFVNVHKADEKGSRWSRHQKIIEDLLGDDDEANKQLVENVATSVLKYYNTHHKHSEGEEEADGDEVDDAE